MNFLKLGHGGLICKSDEIKEWIIFSKYTWLIVGYASTTLSLFRFDHHKQCALVRKAPQPTCVWETC